jgi:two-component system phosphate regulon response regulator PhoB
MKILYIGSNRFEYAALSYKIEPKYSCPVIQAQNHEEVMTAISNDPPDLIILNWQLPGVIMLDLIGEIRSKEETEKTPLILKKVGIETTEDKQNYRLAGIDDFIPRPYKNEELYEVINKWIYH